MTLRPPHARCVDGLYTAYYRPGCLHEHRLVCIHICCVYPRLHVVRCIRLLVGLFPRYSIYTTARWTFPTVVTTHSTQEFVPTFPLFDSPLPRYDCRLLPTDCPCSLPFPICRCRPAPPNVCGSRATFVADCCSPLPLPTTYPTRLLILPFTFTFSSQPVT